MVAPVGIDFEGFGRLAADERIARVKMTVEAGSGIVEATASVDIAVVLERSR